MSVLQSQLKKQTIEDRNVADITESLAIFVFVHLYPAWCLSFHITTIRAEEMSLEERKTFCQHLTKLVLSEFTAEKKHFSSTMRLQNIYSAVNRTAECMHRLHALCYGALVSGCNNCCTTRSMLIMGLK